MSLTKLGKAEKMVGGLGVAIWSPKQIISEI